MVLARGDEFAECLFQRLFDYDPELQKLFHRSLKMQAQKLITLLTAAVEHLDSPIKLFRPLYAAGRRHEFEYGVTPEAYDVMRHALMNTLKAMQLPGWDHEYESAWNQAFMLITDIMAGVMPELNRDQVALSDVHG